MEVKKLLFIVGMACTTAGVFGQQPVRTTVDPKQAKKNERRERINQLIKQEEEGAMIFNKQGAFGFKFNTDGWGMFYEHGKYKTLTNTSLWWLEFGERKHQKEEKAPTITNSSGFLVISSYIFGKRNNFYYLKGGIGRQTLIGGKGNKNGVAVSAIYGGGLSLGLLKPYYIEIEDPNTRERTQIKYDNNDSVFLDSRIILGRAPLTKGLGETKLVPGVHARASLRFDYGRYNELLSAMEVGVNAEYYTQTMPMLALQKERKLFVNAYVALVFGRRK